MRYIQFKRFVFLLCLLSFMGQSCKKSDLAAINTINTNISNLPTAPPESLFLQATLSTQSSFEYYYDLNRFIFPVAQIFTNALKGVSTNTLTEGNSISNRYSIFFSTTSVGNYLTDAERQFYQLSAEEQALRVSWVPIFRILKSYYAFYVSDVRGSIPYSQAFKAKEGILQPAYDKQQDLFDTLDVQLKGAVAALKTISGSEKTLGNYDQYYGTKSDEPTKWIKAANSLRLKIAMRLMKRNPAKLKSIAAEVLGDNVGLMASNEDSWLYQPSGAYTGGSGGNWDPTAVFAKGIKGTVDFMWNNSDPRISLFYKENNYTQENINTAIAAGFFPAGTKEPVRKYIGSYASPDAANAAANTRLQSTITVNGTLTLDTLSTIQDRLISPGNTDGTNASGSASFILISYADVCFMRAELAARGITSENAQTFYNAGISASIQMYSGIASLAAIHNYKAPADSEISSYLASPDVAYNSSKALEQIISQAYINYFLQPNEAWAIVKRTGMPNTATKLVYETFMVNGSLAPYPRRATLGVPSEADDNYANEKAAIDGMSADADFGIPADNTGRVWWDMK